MPWIETLALLATSPIAYGLLVSLLAELAGTIHAELGRPPTGPEDYRWPRY